MSRILIGLVLFSLAFTGCGGGSGAPEMSGSEAPVWPELQAMQSEELMYSLEMSAQMGDWKVFKEGISAEYKAAVEKFVSTPVPDEFANDAVKTAKDDAAQKLQDLLKAVEGSASDSDLKAAWSASVSSLSAIASAGRKSE